MRTGSARLGVLWSLSLLALGAAGPGYGCAASASEPADYDSGTGRPRDAADEAEPYDSGYGYTEDSGEELDAGLGEAAVGEGGIRVDGGTGGDGGTVVGGPCASPNKCVAARSAGTVSGDTSPATNVVIAKGTTSEWIKVRVSEDKAGVIGAQLKVKVQLASPTGTNYDLHVYVDHAADNVECSTVTVESKLAAGQVDQVIDNWGEGALGNGDDDDRTVSIHVENVSGPCGPGHEWTLTITGNP